MTIWLFVTHYGMHKLSGPNAGYLVCEIFPDIYAFQSKQWIFYEAI